MNSERSAIPSGSLSSNSHLLWPGVAAAAEPNAEGEESSSMSANDIILIDSGVEDYEDKPQYFGSLPKDILIFIFKQLGIQDWKKIRTVNRKFKALAEDELVSKDIPFRILDRENELDTPLRLAVRKGSVESLQLLFSLIPKSKHFEMIFLIKNSGSNLLDFAVHEKNEKNIVFLFNLLSVCTATPAGNLSTQSYLSALRSGVPSSEIGAASAAKLTIEGGDSDSMSAIPAGNLSSSSRPLELGSDEVSGVRSAASAADTTVEGEQFGSKSTKDLPLNNSGSATSAPVGIADSMSTQGASLTNSGTVECMSRNLIKLEGFGRFFKYVCDKVMKKKLNISLLDTIFSLAPPDISIEDFMYDKATDYNYLFMSALYSESNVMINKFINYLDNHDWFYMTFDEIWPDFERINKENLQILFNFMKSRNEEGLPDFICSGSEAADTFSVEACEYILSNISRQLALEFLGIDDWIYDGEWFVESEWCVVNRLEDIIVSRDGSKKLKLILSICSEEEKIKMLTSRIDKYKNIIDYFCYICINYEFDFDVRERLRLLLSSLPKAIGESIITEAYKGLPCLIHRLISYHAGKDTAIIVETLLEYLGESGSYDVISRKFIGTRGMKFSNLITWASNTWHGGEICLVNWTFLLSALPKDRRLEFLLDKGGKSNSALEVLISVPRGNAFLCDMLPLLREDDLDRLINYDTYTLSLLCVLLDHSVNDDNEIKDEFFRHIVSYIPECERYEIMLKLIVKYSINTLSKKNDQKLIILSRFIPLEKCFKLFALPQVFDSYLLGLSDEKRFQALTTCDDNGNTYFHQDGFPLLQNYQLPEARSPTLATLNRPFQRNQIDSQVEQKQQSPAIPAGSLSSNSPLLGLGSNDLSSPASAAKPTAEEEECSSKSTASAPEGITDPSMRLRLKFEGGQAIPIPPPPMMLHPQTDSPLMLLLSSAPAEQFVANVPDELIFL